MQKNLLFDGPCALRAQADPPEPSMRALMMTETRFCWRGTQFEAFSLPETGVLLGVIGTQRTDAAGLLDAVLGIEEDVRTTVFAEAAPTVDGVRAARARLDEFEAFLAHVQSYVFSGARPH